MKHLTSNRLNKAAHAFYSSVDAPQPRNLTKELLQTLHGQQQTAQGFFDLENKYQPQYGALNLNLLGQHLFGQPGTPGSLQLGSAANTYTRGSDIADVARYGPASTAAFLRGNPLLANSLFNLTGRLQDSPILSKLNQQASADLNAGGTLTPQEQADLAQQSRAGFAARGMGQGNQSIGAELLSRDAAQRQRLAAAQEFASGVQGLNQNQSDLVGRASQIFSTTLSDPFQAILGRTSGAGGVGGVGAYPQQIGTGARLFDPMNAYASDIYNTNYNAQASTNIANTQAQNSSTNALIGLAGSLLLSDKRLKKNIKRVGTTPSGIPVKEFEYKGKKSEVRSQKSEESDLISDLGPRTSGAKRRFLGVVAQDVEKKAPWAVLTDPFSKMKMVDMSAIDAPFAEVGKLLAA
jgi:hypothetical protein